MTINIWDLVQDNVTMFLGVIILTLLIVLLGVFNDSIKKQVKDYLANFFSGKKDDSRPISAEIYTKTVNELVELRTKMDADRAYIFQFHNGEHFSGQNPRWKMTRTYESCGEGITYEGKNLQNIDVTILWSLLRILFDTSLGVPGVSQFTKNLTCPLDLCKPPKQIYAIDVKSLDGNRGFAKTMLMQQGIDCLFLCAILSETNDVIGFVGLDYCDRGSYEKIMNDNDFGACYLCEAAMSIGYAWAIDPKLRLKSLKLSNRLTKN